MYLLLALYLVLLYCSQNEERKMLKREMTGSFSSDDDCHGPYVKKTRSNQTVAEKHSNEKCLTSTNDGKKESSSLNRSSKCDSTSEKKNDDQIKAYNNHCDKTRPSTSRSKSCSNRNASNKSSRPPHQGNNNFDKSDDTIASLTNENICIRIMLYDPFTLFKIKLLEVYEENGYEGIKDIALKMLNLTDYFEKTRIKLLGAILYIQERFATKNDEAAMKKLQKTYDRIRLVSEDDSEKERYSSSKYGNNNKKNENQRRYEKLKSSVIDQLKNDKTYKKSINNEDFLNKTSLDDEDTNNIDSSSAKEKQDVVTNDGSNLVNTEKDNKLSADSTEKTTYPITKETNKDVSQSKTISETNQRMDTKESDKKRFKSLSKSSIYPINTAGQDSKQGLGPLLIENQDLIVVSLQRLFKKIETGEFAKNNPLLNELINKSKSQDSSGASENTNKNDDKTTGNEKLSKSNATENQDN